MNSEDLRRIRCKGEYLCTAERVTETHPMAKLLGTVEDLEDYKQKIEKQKKLRRKTINAVKKYLPQEEIKYLETKIIEDDSTPVQDAFNNRSNTVQKMNVLQQPLFKNNSEKYKKLQRI